MAPVLALLGQSLQAPPVQSWLASLPDVKAEILDWSDEGEVHRYLESKPGGVAIKHSDEGKIEAIFLMSEGRDGFSQYRGDLGRGLTFSCSPDELVQTFGEPSLRRPAAVGLFNQRTGVIMRFDYPEHSIHFQFRADEPGIELITLMTSADVRRLGNAG
jgi:hypothetical protein